MKKLTNSQKIVLKKIAEKYQLVFLILFGSLVEGKEKNESDAR